MTDMWREGARVYDASDKCPSCPDGGLIVFASDFHRWGQQKVRVCARCKTVYNHDEAQGPVTINPAPPVA